MVKTSAHSVHLAWFPGHTGCGLGMRLYHTIIMYCQLLPISLCFMAWEQGYFVLVFYFLEPSSRLADGIVVVRAQFEACRRDCRSSSPVRGLESGLEEFEPS